MAQYRDGLSIAGLTFQYAGTAKTVLSDVSLHIPKGAFYLLCGTSGCGKSTLLRLIAGFLQPDSGKIYFNGKDVSNLPPEKRNAPMVFQNYAIFPNMTVENNVAFGLKNRKMPKDKIEVDAETSKDELEKSIRYVEGKVTDYHKTINGKGTSYEFDINGNIKDVYEIDFT